MIRVTLELISAITGRTSKLGTMLIANDGEGTPDRGNYNVKVLRKGYNEGPWSTPATRMGTVRDYPRKAYNVWRLIARSVLAAFPEEVPGGRLPKGKPVLDAEVMSGLTELARLAELHGIPGGSLYDDRTAAEVHRAQEWLDAAKADMLDESVRTPDQQFDDALGCNQVPIAREQFQRSIFNGLRTVAKALEARGEFFDVNDADDVRNALTFIKALPL